MTSTIEFYTGHPISPGIIKARLRAARGGATTGGRRGASPPGADRCRTGNSAGPGAGSASHRGRLRFAVLPRQAPSLSVIQSTKRLAVATREPEAPEPEIQ